MDARDLAEDSDPHVVDTALLSCGLAAPCLLFSSLALFACDLLRHNVSVGANLSGRFLGDTDQAL